MINHYMIVFLLYFANNIIAFFFFGNKAKEYGVVDKIIGEDCTMDYIY